MTGMNMTDLVSFGRSWAFAAELSVSGKNFVSKGYDLSQRCYQIENTGQNAGQAEITLKGSKESPVINPAVFIKNWKSNSAKILVNGKETKDCMVGINRELDGNDLVVYISINEVKTVKITILPL
jgi:hypothetical protein